MASELQGQIKIIICFWKQEFTAGIRIFLENFKFNPA
jgi:hypothetical protein